MTPHVLRPVREADLPRLQKLANAVEGSLTTLPNDPLFLEGKVIESIRSFDPRIQRPAGEYYLFVLEDPTTHAIVGTSGIISRVGGFDPFYSYEIRSEPFSHKPLGIEKEVKVLHLKRSHKGPSEVCSLFLHPARRSSGLGRLLSLARFLFMNTFRPRFDAEVIAEMRGWLDENDQSPFWESVGKHFFEHEYAAADFLSGLGNKAFIEDLMPEYPIYLSLLPAEVRSIIGRVHRDTEPALRLLLNEGFKLTDEVDIFDAGPLLRASIADLRIVRESRRARIHEVVPDDPQSQDSGHLIASGTLDFRACLGRVEELGDGAVRISRAVADVLMLEPGADVVFAPERAAT